MKRTILVIVLLSSQAQAEGLPIINEFIGKVGQVIRYQEPKSGPYNNIGTDAFERLKERARSVMYGGNNLEVKHGIHQGEGPNPAWAKFFQQERGMDVKKWGGAEFKGASIVDFNGLKKKACHFSDGILLTDTWLKCVYIPGRD